jgi:hypothetical protein
MTSETGPVEMTAREAFEHLLCHGGVKVGLDGCAAGVLLPDDVRAAQVVLMYELDAVVPIPDLVADDAGIRATLSFSRTPYETFIPWSAVIGMMPLRPEALVPKRERPKLKLV